MSFNTFEKDGKKLLYVPVDIEVDLPSTEDMLDYHHSHCIIDEDYEDIMQGRHVYCMVVSRYPFKDFRRWPHEIFADKSLWKTSIDNYQLYWAPGFRERFPTLVNLIMQQPFEQIAMSGWMLQKGPYGAHHDSSDPTFPMEPRRYNALLTDPTHNTFWLGNNDNEKIYPQVDPRYPCFAFNNADIKHGTDSITGLKIVLGTMGVIDHEKHEALIKRSVEKFPEKAIWI